MHDRPAKYVDNHDGDSVRMLLDQDFEDSKRIRIRMANVWAPELEDKGGLEVFEYVHQWCMIHTVQSTLEWPFLVITHQTSKDNEKTTFGRYVADIYTFDLKHHLNSDVMKYIADNDYTGGIGSIKR